MVLVLLKGYKRVKVKRFTTKHSKKNLNLEISLND